MVILCFRPVRQRGGNDADRSGFWATGGRDMGGGENNCSRLDPGHLNLRKPFLGGGGGKDGEGTQRGKQQERSGTN